MSDRPGWHALLATFPPDAIPTRQPIASPGILATPEGAAVAGWRQLVVHLSDPCNGLRSVLVVVDASGTPISAGDHVFLRIPDSPRRSAPNRSADASSPTARSAALAG